MKRTNSSIKSLSWPVAVLLAVFVTACGGGGNASPPKPAPTLPGAGTGLGGAGQGPSPVGLASIIGAGTVVSPTYAVLAKTAISTTGPTAVTGDLGLSPAAASFFTGFALSADPSGCFSKSIYVTGNLYAANYNTLGCTTPSLLTTAIGDMQTAYTDAAGRPADFTEIGAGNIGGMTLPPGTYKWGSGVLIPSNVTLNGGANDVWIFQIAGGITQASATQVILTGGALPKNIFWQAADVVSIGTTAHMEGVILAQTQITLKTGATANSRLLAQTAVNLDANAVTQPAP
ncbi:MAG: ice-binding family protein [Gallionella sp.]|nr:ice-binding family protein [Gallionella sp.]